VFELWEPVEVFIADFGGKEKDFCVVDSTYYGCSYLALKGSGGVDRETFYPWNKIYLH
jgi:hypothetical protein